jgi:NAD(P)-dependent dehydrogenase (short-subunit alcohol dehydrogenase family)
MAMNPKINHWQGQRVWILGASSGIGEALARALTARGARVAVSARRAAALKQLVSELPDGLGLALPCDAGIPTEVAAAMATLQQRWGGVDLAIYAAGIWEPASADHFTPAQIDSTLDINLRAPMHFAHQTVPHLIAQGTGAIAFISSVAGYRPLPQALLYGTSKAALNYFAGTLHLDLAPRGVGVFLINPGFVDTPMTAVNRFRMPAIISAERAAQEIIKGFTAGDFEIHFPKRFTRSLRALGWLPDSLYYPLVRKMGGV